MARSNYLKKSMPIDKGLRAASSTHYSPHEMRFEMINFFPTVHSKNKRIARDLNMSKATGRRENNFLKNSSVLCPLTYSPRKQARFSSGRGVPFGLDKVERP